jgi:biofilm PGA synthesis N-glycosyltransferase PgaC
VRTVLLDSPQGKASALNEGVSKAQNPIIVFTDARQALEPQSLKILVANFADPDVGCVSGELMLRQGADPTSTEGIGTYWKIEKLVRTFESNTGSVVGVTGAFYAARKDLLVPLPPNTILDDVYTPMHVAKAGSRVIFESEARAWDVPVAAAGVEFRRKVRTLTGNYQLLLLAPWMLTPSNPLLWRLISHKLLRLFVPFALLAVLISAAFITGPFYRAALIAGVVLILLGVSTSAACRWDLSIA